MKVAIISSGESEFFFRKESLHQGIEIATENEVNSAMLAQKHMIDGPAEVGRIIERAGVAVIPSRRPEERLKPRTHNTGAARIKRDAKQRRRRKGK